MRCADARVVPAPRHQPADALSLEGEVRRDECLDAQRLKQLEDENRRLKKLVAEQALDIAALKDVTSRNW
nr:transposase IS3 family protein [uncultured bacterium]